MSYEQHIGSVNCIADSGDIAVISSFMSLGRTGVQVRYLTENMHPAIWCGESQTFHVGDHGTAYRPMRRRR